jgi:hypothetical protein
MPGGGLYRTSRDGKPKYAGFLDDYAFLAQALLALFDATGAAQWRDRAAEVMRATSARFEDLEAGGFFFSEQNARDLIIRQKTGSDSPLPSGNAVAALVLLELGDVATVIRMIAEFAAQIESHGEGMSAMVQAALMLYRKGGEERVAFNPADVAKLNQQNSAADLAGNVVDVRPVWRSRKELTVHLHIHQDYHINSAQSSSDQPLIATRLSVIDEAMAEIYYPPPHEYQSAFMDRSLKVYSGDVTFVVKFKVDRRGESFKLVLAYQACGESACLAPTTLQIAVPTD